jgi:dihydropyrimidine dehydrogenase (NAD+) subunit PreA
VVTPIPKLDQPKANVGSYATTLDRIPRVDETECVGCNLCSLVCPVDGCIIMVERDTGLPPQTWAERSAGTECAAPERAG